MRKADNLPPSCTVVMKSENLYFLGPSGSVQACNGTAFTNVTVLLPNEKDEKELKTAEQYIELKRQR